MVASNTDVESAVPWHDRCRLDTGEVVIANGRLQRVDDYVSFENVLGSRIDLEEADAQR